MTLPLPSRFDERRHQLLLGVEPRDAIRQSRLTSPARLVLEHPRYTQPFAGPPLTPEEERWLRGLRDAGRPLASLWTAVPRHPSARWAVLLRRTGLTSVTLRIIDPARRYVPRRLRIPLDPAAPAPLFVERNSRSPWLWPGAAAPLIERVTGMRGRVVVARAGARRPARWARVIARANSGGPLAWAHGDDRGEFLLVLPPESLGLNSELTRLTLTVEARARPGDPAGAPPLAVRAADPEWDLPLETLAEPDVTPDRVAEGRVFPPDYTATGSIQVTFTYGVILGVTIPPIVIS